MADTPGAKSGSIPSSYIAWTIMLRLWQSTLHRISFTCAVNRLERTAPPNFRLMAEKVLSTFERWW